jgi:hypothetical protein
MDDFKLSFRNVIASGDNPGEPLAMYAIHKPAR